MAIVPFSNRRIVSRSLRHGGVINHKFIPHFVTGDVSNPVFYYGGAGISPVNTSNLFHSWVNGVSITAGQSGTITKVGFYIVNNTLVSPANCAVKVYNASNTQIVCETSTLGVGVTGWVDITVSVPPSVTNGNVLLSEFLVDTDSGVDFGYGAGSGWFFGGAFTGWCTNDYSAPSADYEAGLRIGIL